MRGLVLVAVVGGLAGTAYAEAPRPACARVAIHVTKLIGASEKAQTLLGRRCGTDRWSRDAQSCFTAASGSREAQHCLDRLGKEQRTLLEGDAVRLGDPKLLQWMFKRLLLASPASARARHG
jgi:hypothetical protein